MEVQLNQVLKFEDFVQLLTLQNGKLEQPVEGVDFERLLWALYNFYWSQTEFDQWLEVFGPKMPLLDEIMMRYVAHLSETEKVHFKHEGHREVLKNKLRLLLMVGPMQDILLFFTTKIFDDKFDHYTFKEREVRLGKYLLQRMEAIFGNFAKYFTLFDDDVSEPEFSD